MKSPITSASMTIISTRSDGASRRLLIGAWFAHDSLHRQKNKPIAGSGLGTLPVVARRCSLTSATTAVDFFSDPEHQASGTLRILCGTPSKRAQNRKSLLLFAALAAFSTLINNKLHRIHDVVSC